jgi:hypothetical protein
VRGKPVNAEACAPGAASRIYLTILLRLPWFQIDVFGQLRFMAFSTWPVVTGVFRDAGEMRSNASPMLC